MLRQKTAQCLDSGPLYLLPFIYLSSMFSHQYLYLQRMDIRFALRSYTCLCFSLYFGKANKINRTDSHIRSGNTQKRSDSCLYLSKKKKKGNKCMHNNIFGVIFGKFPLTEDIFK